MSLIRLGSPLRPAWRMAIEKARAMPFSVQPWKSLSNRRLPCLCADRPDGLTGSLPRNSCRTYGRSFLVHGASALAIALVTHASAARAQDVSRSEADSQRLQRLVDELRGRMGVIASVTVTMVERDERTLSVRRAGRSGEFALSVERGFIAGLPAGQVEAALAHELGHVWIHTHHPYLQTEQLANQVAMRVVSRDQLVEVYRSLWGAQTVHGSLEAFLGVAAAR